jgi:methylphosphotriester-DNA--protein-cysteine methyltransferase
VVDVVALAERAVAGRKLEGVGSSSSSPARATRPWRLVDRLGEQIIIELVAGKRSGATKRVLAERYGVSPSGVKRILKAHTGLNP